MNSLRERDVVFPLPRRILKDFYSFRNAVEQLDERCFVWTIRCVFSSEVDSRGFICGLISRESQLFSAIVFFRAIVVAHLEKLARNRKKERPGYCELSLFCFIATLREVIDVTNETRAIVKRCAF